MKIVAVGVARFLRDSLIESLGVYWTLFRLAAPLLIMVRVLDKNFNIIHHISEWTMPLMQWVGLPGEASVVIITAMLLQVYGALLILLSLWTQLDLSIAQVTVLMTIVLIAHALPVEARIAQRTGLRLFFVLALRIGGAFLLAAILHHLYRITDTLQEQATLPFITLEIQDDSWMSWGLNTLHHWAIILVIVIALVVFINILKASHIERLLIRFLSPLLNKIGIGESTITMTLIGLLLGVSYGGGLLINESKKANVNRRDTLCAITLLSLCHSIIEDTLLVMAFGAHWSGVLIGRVVFTVVIVFLFSQLINRIHDTTLNKIISQPTP